MELTAAKDIATAICYKLQPYCDRINIAGSIRRKKPEVKDIEIVCLPKFINIDSADLFGGAVSSASVDIGFIATVTSLGKIEKGKPTGRYCKIVLPENINLDLFIPDACDYFRQYAIRTGSAEYAHHVIAKAWRKLGWVGSDIGLRLEKDCIESKLPGGKSQWTCVRNKNYKPPVWQSEQEFFEWIKIPFIKPELRNI